MPAPSAMPWGEVGDVGRAGGPAAERADRRIVVRPVVGALEFHDLVAAREGAREPQRIGVRLGARGAEHYHLGAGDGVDELPGEFDHRDVEVAEVEVTPRELVAHRVGDRRVGMSQNVDGRRHRIIDVPLSVDVLEFGAFPFVHDEADVVRVGVDGEARAGQHPLGDLVVLLHAAHAKAVSGLRGDRFGLAHMWIPSHRLRRR